MASVGDVISFVASGTFGTAEQDWSMAHNYRVTGINAQGNLQTWLAACADTYTAAWADALLAVMPDDLTLDLISAFNRDDLSEGANLSVDIDGTGSTVGLPQRTAPIIQLNTGLRGRSFRGRASFPAPLASQQDNGVAEDDFVALLVSWAGVVRLLGSGLNTGSMVVYSPTLSTSQNAFNTLVTGFTVRNVLGSQRRRQPTT